MPAPIAHRPEAANGSGKAARRLAVVALVEMVNAAVITNFPQYSVEFLALSQILGPVVVVQRLVGVSPRVAIGQLQVDHATGAIGDSLLQHCP